jgi:hypothetical protein
MPVNRQALLLLEGADRGVGFGPEDPVHGDAVSTCAEQVLQRLDGMLLVTDADQRPGTQGSGGHRRLLLHTDGVDEQDQRPVATSIVPVLLMIR